MQIIRFVVWILAMAFAIANALVQLSGSSAKLLTWDRLVAGEVEQVNYFAGVVVCLMFALIPGMTLTWAFAGALMVAADYPMVGGFMILVGVGSMFTYRPPTCPSPKPMEPAARRHSPVTTNTGTATENSIAPVLTSMHAGRNRWRCTGRRGHASREAWRTTGADGAYQVSGASPTE